MTLFQPGDEVFYTPARLFAAVATANCHLVDERIVGRNPRSLSAAEAAALPLTSITAWDYCSDRPRCRRASGEGKCLFDYRRGRWRRFDAVQLARQLTRLTVIGTACAPETRLVG